MEARVADFGVATLMQWDESMSVIAGFYGYIAPEEGEANNSRLQSFISSILSSIGGVFSGNQEVLVDEEQEEKGIMSSNESVVVGGGVPVNQQRAVMADVKEKNGALGERRTRRALGDIGNLVPARTGVEIGKPLNRPITRNFKAQLVANAQAIADKNVKKPKAEVGEAALKNLTLDSARRRSKKPPKSLTAVLSARSKNLIMNLLFQIACGITARPKDPVVNIDASDINNELAEIEYVEDIYKFYKLSETEGGLRDYMDSQPDINAKMRAILTDWIIEVHKKFDLMPETLYLTMNIVDRYLSVSPVPRRELQLLGISALLISSKYEEIWPPEVNDLIHISDGAYTREQILAMEKAILGQLGWYMTVPTPYVFTVRYTKASIPSDNNEMGSMVFFYTELGLMDYTVIISNSPSKLAASAVYAARCTLKKTPAWTETLKHHTGYSEDQVRDCAKSLVNLHACASESKLKAVFRKYEDPERGAVALFPPARSLLAVPIKHHILRQYQDRVLVKVDYFIVKLGIWVLFDQVLMAPKRSFYPIFLIVSLSALFVFSVYRSSLISLSSSPPITHFPLPIQKSPTLHKKPNFSFTIKVLTYDRLASLTRCLKSLSAAHYDNEKVNLHIYVDHFKVLDQMGEDLDKKLNESRMILDFVDGFEWRYGEKMVHYRTANVGLQAQWLEAWWPSSDDEFAFVVEDDIELSTLYYRFLKGLIVEYYYNASNYSPWVYGASLQRPSCSFKLNQILMSGKHGNKIQLNDETQVFLYQLVGTWGQLLFPRPWKEFRLWYDTHKTKGMKPILDGMVTTGWYKKMGDRIWTPWFIKFIHARGYFNLYSHFSHETALSVSHRDAGVNYGKTAGPDSILIQESSPESNFLKLEPLSNLKWYDFCFREVLPDRVVNSVNELETVLKSAQKANALVLVSIYRSPEAFIRNLLCHFERLNVQNYILMGSDYSNSLLDLSRRGHPVINVDKLFDSIEEFKLISFRKEIAVKAYVTKKALEMKYDTWILDHDMIPFKAELFLNSVKLDSAVDFYVGERLGLLFARSSGSGIWTNHFVNEIVRMPESNLSNDEDRFGFWAGKLLEKKGVKLQRVNEARFGVEIDTSDDSGTSVKNDTKLAFWSSNMGSDLVQSRLERLGLSSFVSVISSNVLTKNDISGV
ncbi:hypothetical protein CTI12_AA371540 [Artemisia annua]|uniref:Uncharacterized protein n=1 Tax=Artemisia annua TaxID=35608 RepID=A0A2U1MK77_ARTAN|nr:hypothetical protein CTI12_AA371540 [Artemisia annua]